MRKIMLLPPSHAWVVSYTNPCKFRHFLTVVKSFSYAFKGSNCFQWIKKRFEPHNAQRNILQQFENVQIYKGLYGKPLKKKTRFLVPEIPWWCGLEPTPPSRLLHTLALRAMTPTTGTFVFFQLRWRTSQKLGLLLFFFRLALKEGSKSLL